MAKLDALTITNPISEDFTWNYNGEPYTIKANQQDTFSRPIALHLAKHLSTKMIQEAEKKKMTVKDKSNPHARIHLKLSQLAIYDTHERRIALYQILGNEELVLEVIKIYPFKGFIGEMSEYENFVGKSKSKSAESESKSDKKK